MCEEPALAVVLEGSAVSHQTDAPAKETLVGVTGLAFNAAPTVLVSVETATHAVASRLGTVAGALATTGGRLCNGTATRATLRPTWARPTSVLTDRPGPTSRRVAVCQQAA